MRIEELWVLPGSDQVEFATKTGATVWFADLIPPDEAIGRRLAACWNACVGIPTETLEAGVVVVPVELLRSIRYLLGKVAEQDALTSYDRRTAKELAGELGNVLHHPRQNVAGGGVSDA